MSVYDFYITPEEYEIAESNGIAAKTLDDRIRVLLWDRKKALTQKPQSRHKAKYRNVAIKNGINEDTFYKRVNNLGMSLEEASSKPAENTRGGEHLARIRKKRTSCKKKIS